MELKDDPDMLCEPTVITFVDGGKEDLEKFTKTGGYPSYVAALRDALGKAAFLQAQSMEGYTEVVVRDPKTKRERLMSDQESDVVL
jgi:hypothetical protein